MLNKKEKAFIKAALNYGIDWDDIAEASNKHEDVWGSSNISDYIRNLGYTERLALKVFLREQE